jgi:hypothetical protein
MYTQLLAGMNVLLHESNSFATQEDLHRSTGYSALQLLGVAVLPDFAHLQIGAGLRDFVLQLAHSDGAIESVVAMTRCSSSTDEADEVEYVKKAMKGDDPTLQFHMSGGARVVQVVRQYRPEDALNLGNAVLIQYDLNKTNRNTAEGTGALSPSGEASAANGADAIPVAELRNAVSNALEAPAAAKLAELSQDEFLDTPFMDLGLHSLAMVELRGRLDARLREQHSAVVLSSTVLFDFPTPRGLLQHLQGTSSASSAPSRPTRRQVSDDDSVFAICSTSCRFPGGISTAEGFHEALLGQLDAVSRLPKEWNWDSRTQYAALLSEDAAESFDAAFFRLNAAEAKHMDPHQRILLEVAHEALMSAGVLGAAKRFSQQVRNLRCFLFLYCFVWFLTYPNWCIAGGSIRRPVQ